MDRLKRTINAIDKSLPELTNQRRSIHRDLLLMAMLAIAGFSLSTFLGLGTENAVPWAATLVFTLTVGVTFILTTSIYLKARYGREFRGDVESATAEVVRPYPSARSAMWLSPEMIYDKLCDGDPLSDNEIEQGLEFYSRLERDLRAAGPVFKLPANEAGEAARMLRGFKASRDQRNPS